MQATVWTAFAAKSNESDTVQVQLGESETLDVLINTIQEDIVNGEEETFDSELEKGNTTHHTNLYLS